MNKTISIWMAVLFLGLAVVPASAKTRVYFFAGQSNMAGIGLDSELVGDVAQYSGINDELKFWNFADATPQWRSYTSSAQWFGPELSFGYEMQNLYPDDDIYMIKCAMPSTRLYDDWSSSEPGGTWYNNFRSTAHEALSDLDDFTIEGMCWMQGEGDAADPDWASHFSQTYQANLTAFIENVRVEFAAPDMPFVLGRILEGWGTPENNARVRTAQETVPSLVGNAAWVNTDDLQISTAIPMHYGTEGTIELGLRFADEIANIPEPSALLPTASSLLFLAGFVRRKRR